VGGSAPGANSAGLRGRGQGSVAPTAGVARSRHRRAEGSLERGSPSDPARAPSSLGWTPLTLGHPAPLIGDVIDRTVQQARHGAAATDGAMIGHPASAGRATGPVRIVHGPQDFAAFSDGDVLVAKTTAPAWTPLFARAAAVVTDSGSLAAHASLVAREYGIPAVVATGDATHRLLTGQIITVDGTAGTVTPHAAA
jgi:phosphohistidine swiveling domain-containing protein